MDAQLKKQLIRHLSTFITKERLNLFYANLKERTNYITIVLEDIFHSQNASAVLRTADCFGIQNIHIIENRNQHNTNPNVSLGSSKWLTETFYNQNKNNTKECLQSLKKEGFKILATTPHNAKSIHDIDVNNEKIALKVAKPIELLSKFLYPIAIPLMKLSNWLTRANKKNNTPIVTEEELKYIIEIGAQEKIIKKYEKEFMHRILKTGDTTAREVMVPRNKMYVLESNMSIKEAINYMIKSKYTKAPIIKNSRDNIIGIIHLKQLLSANQEGKGHSNIMKIARKPIFISQKEIVGDLLRELQLKKERMSIVVDEFGGVEGLLTLEDLLEEIVGEIINESENLSKSIKKIDNNTILVHGDTEIEKIEKIVQEIENSIRKRGKKDIKSKMIGSMVANKLKKEDKIAYIRFASVYKDFQDIDSFNEEIKRLK